MRRASVAILSAFAALGALVGLASTAHAADPPIPPSPDPPVAPAPPPPASSAFDIEFGGGALIPSGDLAIQSDTGLDVGGRFGWSSRIGLGFVLSLDYAPLRQRNPGLGETSDAHLFYGSLEPRFAIGKSFIRVWLAAGPGVIVERTQNQSLTGSGGSASTDSGVTVGGQGGLDFLFFDSGGLSVAGGYTRGLADIEKYQYLDVTVGLLFIL